MEFHFHLKTYHSIQIKTKMNYFSQIVVVSLLSQFNCILQFLCLFLSIISNYKIFFVNDKQITNIALKKIKYSTFTDIDKPFGFFVI